MKGVRRRGGLPSDLHIPESRQRIRMNFVPIEGLACQAINIVMPWSLHLEAFYTCHAGAGMCGRDGEKVVQPRA
eukprot:366012-Chlamydomonas_euryale.AAC.16